MIRGITMRHHTDTRTTTRLAVFAAALLLFSGGCAKSTTEGQANSVAGTGTSAPTKGSSPSATTASSTASVAGLPAMKPSAGCGKVTPSPSVEAERTLTVNDVARRYLLTVPNAHDGKAPLPVVFDFHGLMEGAEVHAKMSNYSALAEEKGFIAVFPHGTGTPLRWNANPASPSNDDLTYFDVVLKEIGSALCVDTSRIYATGLSNGAMFTSILLCQRADVIAAAAPVAGLTDSDSCQPSRPVPIVTFHGTIDPILLFNGGVDVSAIPGGAATTEGPTTTRPPAELGGPGYPASAAAFAKRNGCDAEPTDTNVTAEVIHRVYRCPAGADVEFYIIVGGGHSWPSSEFSKSIGKIVGPTTFDIDATRDAWTFLSRFTNN